MTRLESRAMRRWVLTFLLLVVPFQLVWGAAAPYCAHETELAAKKHFGHHEHRHQGAEPTTLATEDTGDAAGAYHADCETCHLGTSIPLPPLGIEVTVPPHSALHSEPDPCYRSHIPSGPERPDRIELTAAARFGGGVEFSPLFA